LIERAIEIDQHVCGTVRSDHGFPVQLQATTVSLEVGQWMDLSCGRICAFAWQDSAHCQLLSSYHSPEQGSVRRRVSGTMKRVNRDARTAFVEYNVAMAGNDAGDMLRSRVSCHVRAAKRWKAVFSPVSIKRSLHHIEFGSNYDSGWL
jgi:hypothetical protein